MEHDTYRDKRAEALLAVDDRHNDTRELTVHRMLDRQYRLIVYRNNCAKEPE